MNLNDAETLALTLMGQHGLLDDDWSFEWDSAKRRFGCCNYTNKVISLSRHLVVLNPEHEVRDTILHEIAHALAPGAHHGHEWKRVARSIGAAGTRCYSEAVAEPLAPFEGTCPNCGLVIKRHRRRRIACVKCCNKYNGGMFTIEYLFVWSERSDSLRFHSDG